MLRRDAPQGARRTAQHDALGVQIVALAAHTADELVKGNNTIFVATGVTDGQLVSGVRREGNWVHTESIVLRGASGTLRRISSEHLLTKWG